MSVCFIDFRFRQIRLVVDQEELRRIEKECNKNAGQELSQALVWPMNIRHIQRVSRTRPVVNKHMPC